MTWTISKLFHQHQNRNLRFPIRYCGQLCRMLRWGQAWQGEWLSDHPCSVKYRTVPSEVLFLCCGMVYKLTGPMVETAHCSYGHSTGLTDAFSVSLDINGKLLTGLKLGKTSSRHSFFRRVLTRAFFHSSGKYPIWRDLFAKSVYTGSRESRHFKSHVGIGSLLHCLFGDCLISFLTSSSVRGWEESNMSSSFTGTLGIVIGSGSWLSNFVLIFLIFIIKKSPNASARSFNERVWKFEGFCSIRIFYHTLFLKQACDFLQ